MGLETICAAKLNDQCSDGKAHCGDGEIEFRGDFRFKWKWAELESVTVDGDWLVLQRKGVRADLHLGSAAEKWKHAILNPKSVMDKIGLKPDHRYQLWGEFEPEFVQDAHTRAGEASMEGPFDIVFVHLHGENDLSQMVNARAEIKRDGMIWAVWVKGRKEFNDSHIRAYCLANGLVDVKIASVSSFLTSCKYVIPVKDR